MGAWGSLLWYFCQMILIKWQFHARHCSRCQENSRESSISKSLSLWDSCSREGEERHKSKDMSMSWHEEGSRITSLGKMGTPGGAAVSLLGVQGGFQHRFSVLGKLGGGGHPERGTFWWGGQGLAREVALDEGLSEAVRGALGPPGCDEGLIHGGSLEQGGDIVRLHKGWYYSGSCAVIGGGHGSHIWQVHSHGSKHLPSHRTAARPRDKACKAVRTRAGLVRPLSHFNCHYYPTALLKPTK